MSLVRDSYIYKLTRRGRKLQVSDDSRTVLALPRDVPERTWAEILQKEENELLCFEIREEIIEEALRIGYEHYMERQTTYFTVFCAAQAWLKLIDWNFYRHDPGEDPTAYPPCYIPKREESWTPDDLPEPCQKDSWCRNKLVVLEECADEPTVTSHHEDAVEIPVIEPIPEQYWFPGKINLITDYYTRGGEKRRHVMDQDSLGIRPSVSLVADKNWHWHFQRTDDTPETSTSSKIGAESEVLQRITDYGVEELPTSLQESHHSSLKPPTPVDGSLRGAGDSVLPQTHRRRVSSKSKTWARSNSSSSACASSSKSIETLEPCRCMIYSTTSNASSKSNKSSQD